MEHAINARVRIYPIAGAGTITIAATDKPNGCTGTFVVTSIVSDNAGVASVATLVYGGTTRIYHRIGATGALQLNFDPGLPFDIDAGSLTYVTNAGTGSSVIGYWR